MWYKLFWPGESLSCPCHNQLYTFRSVKSYAGFVAGMMTAGSTPRTKMVSQQRTGISQFFSAKM